MPGLGNWFLTVVKPRQWAVIHKTQRIGFPASAKYSLLVISADTQASAEEKTLAAFPGVPDETEVSIHAIAEIV